MHETMNKTKELCHIKDTLCDALKFEFGKGVQNINTQEVGQVVDMIKDLAEAEEKCWKACYYKKLIEEMDEEEEYEGDEEYRMGYNSRRYASGRYAPKGRGHISGYRPYPDYEGPWRDEMTDEHRMLENLRMGYHAPMTELPSHSRYGRAYDEYRESKKHYTSTNSPSDKEEMERHANEHISDTIATIREIYKASDPELKKRIKADMTKLVGEMPT